MLLDNQAFVSTSRGMPVETLDDSQRVESITGETVQLNYDNAGTLTADAGQAAGTFVVGKLAQGAILNALTDMGGSENDTSLTFTSTALTSEVGLPTKWDTKDRKTITERFEYIDSFLLAGEYCVDYVHGVIYGKKADNSTTLTATAYSIPVRGGTAALPLGSVTVTNDVTVQGDVAHDAVDAGDPVKIGARARSTQIASVAEDDRADLVTTLNSELINAGYSYTNQNNRTGETDPISTHHSEATLADVTNGADGTYYYYTDMDGYSNLGLQLNLSGGSGTCTCTVEGTIQDDGTAQSSCAYGDVTTDAYGVASFTATDILNDSQGYFGQFKFVRVKVVAATGAADDADWTIYSKKKY